MMIVSIYILKIYFSYLAFKYYTEGRRFTLARNTASGSTGKVEEFQQPVHVSQ